MDGLVDANAVMRRPQALDDLGKLGRARRTVRQRARGTLQLRAPGRARRAQQLERCSMAEIDPCARHRRTTPSKRPVPRRILQACEGSEGIAASAWAVSIEGAHLHWLFDALIIPREIMRSSYRSKNGRASHRFGRCEAFARLPQLSRANYAPATGNERSLDLRFLREHIQASARGSRPGFTAAKTVTSEPRKSEGPHRTCPAWSFGCLQAGGYSTIAPSSRVA